MGGALTELDGIRGDSKRAEYQVDGAGATALTWRRLPVSRKSVGVLRSDLDQRCEICFHG